MAFISGEQKSKNEEDGPGDRGTKAILVTENKAKATLLNLPFQYVFSQLSPLRLGQLCVGKIQELLENIPQNLKCKYPLMPEIKIDENRILKLLSNLKVDQAAVRMILNLLF